MDSKRVIELAREADACHDNVQVTPFLERFAALRKDIPVIAFLKDDSNVA